MKPYSPRSFSFPQLEGISEKTMTTHIGLYEGYVKHFNTIEQKINELSKSQEDHTFEINELHRRKGFEFNGIRNHELFFEQFVGSAQEASSSSTLYETINKQYGSIEDFVKQVTQHATTRGIGWTIVSYDKDTDHLMTFWVDEQHLGQAIQLSPILLIDVWEHAYLYDYAPSDRKKYIEAIFTNLDWSVCDNRFESSRS